jgi:hypothetical protein
MKAKTFDSKFDSGGKIIDQLDLRGDSLLMVVLRCRLHASESLTGSPTMCGAELAQSHPSQFISQGIPKRSISKPKPADQNVRL